MPAEPVSLPPSTSAPLKRWMSVTAALENLAGEFTQAFLEEGGRQRGLSASDGRFPGPARLRLELQSEPAIPSQPPNPLHGPHHLQGLNYTQALSHTFSPQELELTAWLRGAELREEYAIMRLFLLRMMQMTAGIETLAEMIEFINIYGMSLLRLAKILETLNGGEDAGERLTRDLLEVADQVLKEKQQGRIMEAEDDNQDF